MAELNYQEEGRKLLTAFYGAVNALRLYPVENKTVQTALTELHRLFNGIVEHDGSAEIRVVGDFFFLNETRLRLDLSNFATFGSFARALQDHGIGAVEVLPGDGGKDAPLWPTPPRSRPFQATGYSGPSTTPLPAQPGCI